MFLVSRQGESNSKSNETFDLKQLYHLEVQLPFLSELTFADISFLLSALVSPPMAPIAHVSDSPTQLIDQGPTMGGFQNLLPVLKTTSTERFRRTETMKQLFLAD